MDDKKQTKPQTISRKRGTKSFKALSERLKRAGAQGIKMTLDGKDFWTLSEEARDEKMWLWTRSQRESFFQSRDENVSDSELILCVQKF